MTLSSITFLICSMILSSCATNRFNSETIEFKAYLKKEFNADLQDGTYMLVPSSQCKACISIDAKLDSLFWGSPDSLYLVTSIDTHAFFNFRHKYFDEADALLRLSFIKYSNQVVKTRQGKIVKIQKYDLSKHN